MRIHVITGNMIQMPMTQHHGETFDADFFEMRTHPLGLSARSKGVINHSVLALINRIARDPQIHCTELNPVFRSACGFLIGLAPGIKGQNVIIYLDDAYGRLRLCVSVTDCENHK